MVSGDDGLEYQAIARAAGSVKGNANARQDPDDTAEQRVTGDSQDAQAPRGDRNGLAASRRPATDQPRRLARLKSDRLLVLLCYARFLVFD
jgi:hypothetical protein